MEGWVQFIVNSINTLAVDDLGCKEPEYQHSHDIDLVFSEYSSLCTNSSYTSDHYTLLDISKQNKTTLFGYFIGSRYY